MEIFNLTLTQMLMMFTLILAGFILRKAKILPEVSDVTMSRLETYIFVPALSIYTWMDNCSVQSIVENAPLVLYGLAAFLFSILLAYPLSGLFVRHSKGNAERSYQRSIYKYAMTFGNYGFMGNFIVLGIWGSEGLYKYSMFTLATAIMCSSWGLIILIPKSENPKKGIKEMCKRVFTVPIIGLLIGLAAGLLGLKQYTPAFLQSAISNAANCMGPVAMILAGFVIGGYNLRGLVTNKKVYIATFLRLILLPAVMVLLLRAFGASREVMTLALIAFGAPLGLNTVVYPAAYGGDTQTGASMAMISHVLSVATIPLMYLVFIVLT